MNHRSGTHGKAAGKTAKQGRAHPLPAPQSLLRPIECGSFAATLRHFARKSFRRFFSP
ncbi:hypothetical protein [Noviherbaspirillum denitrificans]|uniref:hypothetical protein n=1 Tax=Noviherbaspirillum denitrificans TaxID=1968433 RepID=UPI0014836F77|nr:hypothetical protein [Noviherbaspirillum denitrificans]